MMSVFRAETIDCSGFSGSAHAPVTRTLIRVGGDQSQLSRCPVTRWTHDRSMATWPHSGKARLGGRSVPRPGDHASDLPIQRDAPVQSDHHGVADRRACNPKVTRSSRSGSMFITEPGRGLTCRATARKSHHADAHTWRRVFAAAPHPNRATVAGESMHGTADRLPAARTWVRSTGAGSSGPAPIAALHPGGQERAGRG